MTRIRPIKVLIVDDSALLRRSLTRALSAYPELEVIGAAPDPYVARDLIVKLRPNVLSLDVEMPRMDGITFLRKLMHHCPMPVVILSSLTHEGGELAVRALEAGALAVLSKPRAGAGAAGFAELAHTLISVAGVDAKRARAVRDRSAARPLPLITPAEFVLAIGGSTGGTTALESILTSLPPNLPGTVVSQHLPAHFTAALAKRLASETGMDVREAEDGESIDCGKVLVAPGDRHLLVKRSRSGLVASVQDGPTVNRHRPSVDVMFSSVAKSAGPDAVGVILTGMGRDGAKGLLQMKQAGATTIAQDEASCVVFGMPKAAIEIGAATRVVSLGDLPTYLTRVLDSARRSSTRMPAVRAPRRKG